MAPALFLFCSPTCEPVHFSRVTVRPIYCAGLFACLLPPLSSRLARIKYSWQQFRPCCYYVGRRRLAVLINCVCADHIIADEFSGELADGMAYVAGHDDENRPVVVSSHGSIELAAINSSHVQMRKRACL
jgi:hypothetical protein